MVELEDSPGNTQAPARFVYAKQPVPFEELLVPFVNRAGYLLKNRVGSEYDLLSGEAHAHLERSLLKRLSYASGQALYLEFAVFHSVSRAFPQRQDSDEPGRVAVRYPSALYDAFVKRLSQDACRSFLREYPVLARLVADLAAAWCDAVEEMLQRLSADWATIQTISPGESEPGSVLAIETDLADRHHRGRSVMVLHFASGLKLVYKPRSIALAHAFFQLVAWCNREIKLLPLRVLRVIERETYGWMEYAGQAPCRDIEQVRRYYERTGHLLCLLYVLHGIDLHSENIIASGEHPVLVDLEMLVHPRLVDGDLSPVQSGWPRELHDTVLQTGLLPVRAFGMNGDGYDASGLGSVAGQKVPFETPRWQNINTDTMTLAYEPQYALPRANRPVLEGEDQAPADYITEVISGFEKMYRFLLKHRTTLLGPDSILTCFAHQQVRFVFRSTAFYHAMIYRALHPTLLREGADRTIQFDVLRKSFSGTSPRQHLRPLIDMEFSALNKLDIPRFVAYTDDDGLSLESGERIEHCFLKPGFDMVTDRLKQLSEADLARNTQLIRKSLTT